MVAVAADGPRILECVWTALNVRDDVVWFGAVGSARVFPVEVDAAAWAACESVVEVVVESLLPDSSPLCCSGA